MRHIARLLSLVVVVWLSVAAVEAQTRNEIPFPDIPGYVTLKCDLHMHTVFSDGAVWPTVRVDEAWRIGLDMIVISDHIEYQPHADDIPTQHERPYELARGAAATRGILLAKGAEITRDTPPGHFNAVFLRAIDPVDTPEFLDAIRVANEQGAFVFWNHQAWQGEEAGTWRDVHQTMFENEWFQGMEVYNSGTYYPTAHRWCVEKGLTMLGNSDIHGPDLLRKNTAKEHRAMTLVFAEERSVESVHEALREGRTVVWGGPNLVGREEWLKPLFAAMVTVHPAHLKHGDGRTYFKVHNMAPVEIKLVRRGATGPAELTLPAEGTVLVVANFGDAESMELEYTAENLLVAPETGLDVVLTVPQE